MTILTYQCGIPVLKRYAALLKDESVVLYDFYEPLNALTQIPLIEILSIQLPDKEFCDLPNSIELVMNYDVVHDEIIYKDAEVAYQSDFRFGVPTNEVLCTECPSVFSKGNTVNKRPLMLPITDNKIYKVDKSDHIKLVVIADTAELRKEWWEKLSRNIAICKITK